MIDIRALLFDVGNTRLKWGLLENGHIRRTGSATHTKIHDSGFASLRTRLPRRVHRVFASNVAGASFATRLSAMIGIHCGARFTTGISLAPKLSALLINARPGMI